MAFCKNCGTLVQDEIKFCPNCGAELQSQSDVNDVESNKIMAVISYLGILIIIPLIKGDYRKSKFLKFHLNHAILFCIGWGLVAVLRFIPFIGYILCSLLAILIAILQITGIVYAIKGKMRSLPIISKIKIIK